MANRELPIRIRDFHIQMRRRYLFDHRRGYCVSVKRLVDRGIHSQPLA